MVGDTRSYKRVMGLVRGKENGISRLGETRGCVLTSHTFVRLEVSLTLLFASVVKETKILQANKRR